MAGVDPISLAVIGAGVGAIANKDDPIKGAILGGAAGYGGGTMLGAGTAPAGGVLGGTGLTANAAGQSSAMGLGGGITGISSTSPSLTAPIALGSNAPLAAPAGITLGSGLTPPATMAMPVAAQQGMTPMQGLMASRLLATPSEGTRTNVSPPLIRGGKQVNLADPILGLLANQPQRRRQPLSLLG